jgi:hypothetical protein
MSGAQAVIVMVRPTRPESGGDRPVRRRYGRRFGACAFHTPARPDTGAVLLLWTPEVDGIDDPDDETNGFMGMRDYRPQSWHHRFDQYAGDAEHPSALY